MYHKGTNEMNNPLLRANEMKSLDIEKIASLTIVLSSESIDT